MISKEELILISVKEFQLNAMSHHGTVHWLRVLDNAMILANQDEHVDKDVVTAFALLHDCKREDDGADKGHGSRAADFIVNLELGLTQEQMGILVSACILHDQDVISENPTIGACLDADRLDLLRVGIIPHSNLMSTALGKYMADKMQNTVQIINYLNK